ncbi:MAG: B3/4 domain protein [Firmicutes bacterium ADurb.Bin182]|nr:MAG: B3/4 domain protein [Firmicutes bacterium ADurb.Bin182]
MVTIQSNIKEKYPETHFGALVLLGFKSSLQGKEEFSRYAARELQKIRSRHPNYDRKQFCCENHIVSAYIKYYKKFKKTYHVLPQIESIIHGKEIPDTLPLIQALLLTEIQTGMLIAGHDLDNAALPFSIECAEGGETYVGAGGREIVLKPGDISMRDQSGFVLSIIYGQDERTRIKENTQNILYLIDGVSGIDKKYYADALDTLIHNVRIFQPSIEPVHMEVL